MFYHSSKIYTDSKLLLFVLNCPNLLKEGWLVYIVKKLKNSAGTEVFYFILYLYAQQ